MRRNQPGKQMERVGERTTGRNKQIPKFLSLSQRKEGLPYSSETEKLMYSFPRAAIGNYHSASVLTEIYYLSSGSQSSNQEWGSLERLKGESFLAYYYLERFQMFLGLEWCNSNLYSHLYLVFCPL